MNPQPAPAGASRPPIPFSIPSLDGIRAAAVLLVFVAHAGLPVPVPGNFGVTIFFFLSGYLITTLARMELERTGGFNFSGFYLRRVLRILPPFYVVLAGASLLSVLGALEGTLQPEAFLAQALHLSNYYIINHGWWDGRAPGTWVFWSLAVEEHFYLFFPLAFVALKRRLSSSQRQLVVLALGCLAVLAWRLLLVYALGAPKDRTYVATDTRMDSILFGCLLAVYGNPMLDPTRISRRWWLAFWLPCGLVGLAVSFLVTDRQFQETFRYSLQGLSLFPLFVVAIRYPQWGVMRLLNVRWMRYVGLLSYSLYLVHPTVIFAVHQWTTWPVWAQALLSLTTSLLLAALVHHAVEKPVAGLRKHLMRPASARRDDLRNSATVPPTSLPAVKDVAVA